MLRLVFELTTGTNTISIRDQELIWALSNSVWLPCREYYNDTILYVRKSEC